MELEDQVPEHFRVIERCISKEPLRKAKVFDNDEVPTLTDEEMVILARPNHERYLEVEAKMKLVIEQASNAKRGAQ